MRRLSDTKYIHFTDEQKERANSIDLVDYLRSRGESFEKSGRELRLKSDKRFTIRGNRWYNQYDQEGGYPIDFVKMFYGLDFPSAVIELLDEKNSFLIHTAPPKEEKPAKPFALPPKNNTMKRVFAYLTKHRGIEPSVLSFFAKEKLIYESDELSEDKTRRYNNLVFVGLDANGTPAHAHKRSAYSVGNKFVQNVEGSNPHHSFHYLGGSERLYVFEAPIDMLSFITMYKDTDWKRHNYVALCGTSSMPITELLSNNNHINRVVLCTDNDIAGHQAAKRFEEMLTERGVAVSRITPQTKDFNDDLAARYIEEVMSRSEPEMKMG